MANIPEKRSNPFEKTLSEMRKAQTEKDEKEAAEKKAPAEKKQTAEKKAPAEKKPAAEKKTASKTAEKKPAAKKATTKKATTKKTAIKKAEAKPAKVKIDAKTGVAKVVTPKTKKAADAKTTKASTKASSKTTTTKATTKKITPKKTTKAPAIEQVVETPIIVETPVEEIKVVETAPIEEAPVTFVPVQETPEVIVPVKKPRKISKRAQLLKEQKAAERAAAKAAKMMPVEIVRPVPKKFKLATKEEKAQFKKLEESFDYLVNLASVVEEKTMDKEEIPDITLGELHVIQMVKKLNNKPMTLIANNLKVTVGSLITCLNRLIQKDYIIRTRDEMDNRVILLSITPKAQKVLKAHDKFHDDILGLLLENGVTLPQATKVLSTLNTVLEVYYDPIHNSFTKEEKGSKAKKK